MPHRRTAAATALPHPVRAAFAAVALLAACLLVAGNAQAWSLFGKYDTVDAANGVVTIPVADIADGSAHYFQYMHDGRPIKFFVVKSTDNVLRAAFDACDVCYPEGKGYAHDGDYMVCNNCGQRFHTARINEVKGGCNPAPLNRVYDQATLTISVRDIVAGAGYFPKR
ncbi:MAG: Fe-S-containing protein [Desulfovibrionaceae bacterium]